MMLLLLMVVNCLVLYLLGIALFVANFWLAFLWKDLLKLTLSRSLLIFDRTGVTSYQLARLQVPPPPLDASHVCGIIRPTSRPTGLPILRKANCLRLDLDCCSLG